MKAISADDTEIFMVQKDESNGSMFLRVVVGGITMYEVEATMTSEIIAAFDKSPKELLAYVQKIRLAR